MSGSNGIRVKRKSELPKTFITMGFTKEVAHHLSIGGMTPKKMLDIFRGYTLDEENFKYCELEYYYWVGDPKNFPKKEVEVEVNGRTVGCLVLNLQEIAWPAFLPYLNKYAYDYLEALWSPVNDILIRTNHCEDAVVKEIRKYCLRHYESINRIRINKERVERFVTKAVNTAGYGETYRAARYGWRAGARDEGMAMSKLCHFLRRLVTTDEFKEMILKSLSIAKQQKLPR